MARDRREDAAEEVEILVALRVPDTAPLTAHEGDGLVVVEGEPARHDLLVPLEQRAVVLHATTIDKREGAWVVRGGQTEHRRPTRRQAMGDPGVTSSSRTTSLTVPSPSIAPRIRNSLSNPAIRLLPRLMAPATSRSRSSSW